VLEPEYRGCQVPHHQRGRPQQGANLLGDLGTHAALSAVDLPQGMMMVPFQ
jgi:hypothetical protein